MRNRKKQVIVIVMIIICLGVITGLFLREKEQGKERVEEITNPIEETTYEMPEEKIKELPTTEIIEQTEEQEKEVAKEQEVESESFEEQGEIAYHGTSEYPNVRLGSYKGLTYYSQIDSRWRFHLYTSIGSSSQNIGTSGCGPTSAAMIVTATKGAITPPEMGDLFVKYGYRSANNGTYWSAFKFVADTFDITYQETYQLEEVIHLLKTNHYVIASCANGLFTTGGHFIVLTGIEGDILKIYDPYLYSGKFETSTRRGKVEVQGNTIYCSVHNFREYANYQKFFVYEHDGKEEINNKQQVNTASYTRYVKAKIGLNIRNAPNKKIVGALKNGSKVMVYETSGEWSRIGNSQWVSSNYLSTNTKMTNRVDSYPSTSGQYRILKRTTNLYSNQNLTGIRYCYLPQTKIRIIKNISSTVDYVCCVKTGRYAYVNKKNYK